MSDGWEMGNLFRHRATFIYEVGQVELGNACDVDRQDAMVATDCLSCWQLYGGLSWLETSAVVTIRALNKVCRC